MLYKKKLKICHLNSNLISHGKNNFIEDFAEVSENLARYRSVNVFKTLSQVFSSKIPEDLQVIAVFLYNGIIMALAMDKDTAITRRSSDILDTDRKIILFRLSK